LLVAWPKIEEVHKDSHGPSLAFPICLYPSNAAKMTIYMGHIYCWCCLMFIVKSKHYKYNAIILTNVFDKYKRRLIASTTITTTNKSSFLNDISKSINDDLDECEQFFKIKCKRLNEIHERVVKREKSELERQRESEKDAPEVCFVDEALKLL